MKREGTPRTPAEKTLAAAAYAVYEERRRAGAPPEAAWNRVGTVVDGKIRPFYLHHTSITSEESAS